MVWLQPIFRPTICEKNKYQRWTFQRADVPVQHPLQHYGFLQPEEWIPEIREPEQALHLRWKVQCRRCVTQRILGINFTHVILTAEADSLSTDAKELLEDDGSSRSNDLSVLAGIDSTCLPPVGISEEDDQNTHAAILQLRRQKEQSQIRESEQLIRCSMTSNRLHWTLKVPILMTLRALCPIRYTKGEATGDQIRRWHTLQVLCMPSPPRAGNEGTLSCSTVFQHSTSARTPLHGRCHCWRCQCSSIQILQKSGVPRSAQFFSFHYVERDATWGQYGTSIWKQTEYWWLKQYSFSQLCSAGDLDCCFVAFLSWRKAIWNQNYENSGATRVGEHKVTRKDKMRTARTPVLKSCWGTRLERVIQTQRTSTIPWLHLKIMMFVNPDESWSSKTQILGYDQQICPGTSPFSWPFVRNPPEITVEGHPRNWMSERTKSRKPRSRRLWNIFTRIGTQPDGSSHLGPGLLYPHLLPCENGAQTRRVGVPIGNQLMGTAQIECVRLRHGSDTMHVNEVSFTDPYLGIHGDENMVCLWCCTSFHHFRHLSWCSERRVKIVIVPFHATRMKLLAHSFECLYDCFGWRAWLAQA